jgi:hypothetical protein
MKEICDLKSGEKKRWKMEGKAFVRCWDAQLCSPGGKIGGKSIGGI